MTWWRRLVTSHDRRWDSRAGRAEAWALIELRQVNRLMVGLHWWSETRLAFEVSWGHQYSDPVWSAGFAVELPESVADWLGRHKVGS